MQLNDIPSKRSFSISIAHFVPRITGTEDTNRYSEMNSINDAKYSCSKENVAIDYNYNTSSEYSRNKDELLYSANISLEQTVSGAETAVDDEEAQDLSMSNYESVNHIKIPVPLPK